MIHKLGGKAIITIPYELKAGEDAQHIVVWYVTDDGEPQKMETSYDSTTKTVTFETDHFSYYVISQESDLGELSNNNGFPIIYIVIGGVVLLVVISVAVIVKKRLS